MESYNFKIIFLLIESGFFGINLKCTKSRIGRKRMRKTRKCFKRVSACALSAAMVFTMATPFAPLTAEAAGEDPVNLAIGATATANDSETSDYTADKAIDGIVNRDAPKPQSRWATNTSSAQTPKILTVDLGETKTFQSFVIAWERTNITSYEIQTSDTGGSDASEWTTVYEKEGSDQISALDENIHLAEPAEARYVRLYVDGYDLNPGSWQSVSVYEFQVYENEIPDELLTEENYNLEGTAEASDYEPTEGDTQAASMAIDGDQTTRWATNPSDDGVARTLTVTLPASQRVQFFRIIWERLNIESYKIEVAESDDAEFTEVYAKTEPITATNEVISLDAPVWAKKIRLTVDGYNGGSNDWPNVSVAEFESYAVEPAQISEDATPEEVADLLGAPTINEDGTALVLPEVPEGFTVEFLADYEEVVGKDGTIYTPLTEKTVKGIYKVTKGEESAEGSVEYTLAIPGRYDDEGANAKPTVIPELAEWYGKDAEGSFTVGGRILVSEGASEFMDAAEALAEDYEAELGTAMTVETGDAPQAGDIYFISDETNGLGEEGYIMDIGEYVTVSAENATGAYWATRSILQITELNDETMPYGITKDYPKYEVRGFMLDVARKPISMETLQDIAKEMAYYKMNEFHVHLNDNLIFYEDYASAEEARELAYTGFRLESDVLEGGNDGLNQADLTNEDLYYTKAEFRDFILSCRSMGVNITPEFDTPGHSGAFTKVRPDLMLQNIVSGAANRAGEQFDLSPENYDESLAFVESIWDEYLTEDMFDQSMTVHIGTDEYYGEKNRFRMFSDDLIEYVQSKGYTVRLWGSLSSMPGEADVRSEGVQMNVWNTGWANPTNMYNEGFELINTIDGQLYMVPAAGYYFDYLNTQNLYNNWVPNNFSGTVIPAGSEQMLGSTYAIWNDSVDTKANGISEVDIYDRFADAVPTMASKNWGEAQDQTWAEMEATVDELGDAANSNPYHEASADENGEYMSYEFDDTTDSSANGRDLAEPVNAEIADGSLKLNGGESYVSTPIDKLATGNTLEFDITLDTPAQAGDILFEADNEGSNGDYVHDIRIMDDGRLGFRRELYDYYFDYKLPVGETVHLSISTNGTSTTLTVNGTTYEASGVYRNRQTDGEVRVEGITRATFLLPIQRIGSETNAIEAVIDNVTVKQGAAVDYNKSAWSKVEVDSETVYSSTEGLFEYAFDGNSGTIWHSNWQGASDKLKPQGTFDEIGGVIDLGQKYTINQFKFTPRSGTNSGQVTKADLYVKANEGDDWIKVAEDAEFADDATTKTFYFDEQEVQYVWFVAKESDDGWVAVSEFDIANAPAQSYNVYVEAQEGGTVSGGAKGIAENTEITVTAEADKGYTFAGWYDAVTGTKVSDNAEYTFAVTENTALTAQFTKNEEPDPEPGEEISTAVLEYAIELAADVNTDGVIDAVKTNFENALKTAEDVLAKVQAGDTSVTQSDVDSAWQNLIKAMQYMEFKSADKKDLAAVIAAAEDINSRLDQYLDTGKDAFTSALATAQEVYEDVLASQDEVNSAWMNLLNAMADLRLIPDKGLLEDLIAQAEALNEADYEAQSFAVMRTALAAAKEVFADENATEDDVNSSVEALEDALAKLTASGDGTQAGGNDQQSGSTGNDGQSGTGDDGKSQTGGMTAGITTGKTASSSQSAAKATKTGDTSAVFPFAAAAVAAAAAAVVVIRKREEEK